MILGFKSNFGGLTNDLLTYRMLRDAEFFRSRLGKLDGASDIGDYVVSIVRSKTVAEQPAAQATPTSNESDTPTVHQKEESGTSEESKS